MATTDIYTVAGSLVPMKTGLRFLGGNVDDGVQVDAAIAAIVAGNHTKGTFTANIMVPDSTGTYTFFGAGDASAVEYTTFSVEAGTIQVVMVKAGPTTEIDVNTAAGSIKPHTWHNVAIVQDGKLMKIYIDGIEQALTWTTATNVAQWYEDLNNIDGATIGAADSVAGGALLTQEFAGYISDVRIWSGTTAANVLSKEQIELVMSGATVGTPHNSWNIDRNVLDTGSGADNGTIVGDLIYCEANEFASKMTFSTGTPVVADKVLLSMNDSMGMALVIQAA